MAVELKVPAVGESITEVQIGKWLKAEGQTVEKDEDLVEIETDKATVDIVAPVTGTVSKVLKKSGETAAVGEVIGYMEPGAGAPAVASAKTAEPAAADKDGAATAAKTTAQSADAAAAQAQ